MAEKGSQVRGLSSAEWERAPCSQGASEDTGRYKGRVPMPKKCC